MVSNTWVFRLTLKNKKRKQEDREAILRMVSSQRGRSAGISDLNFTFAKNYAPPSLPGQGSLQFEIGKAA